MMITSAYVSIVNENRTIELPAEIPIGARVAIVMLPSETRSEEERLRDMRFQKVMDAIRAAISNNFTPPAISDRELSQLIKEARQAAKA